MDKFLAFTEIGYDAQGRIEVIRKASLTNIHQRFNPEDVDLAVKCFRNHVDIAFQRASTST